MTRKNLSAKNEAEWIPKHLQTAQGIRKEFHMPRRLNGLSRTSYILSWFPSFDDVPFLWISWNSVQLNWSALTNYHSYVDVPPNYSRCWNHFHLLLYETLRWLMKNHLVDVPEMREKQIHIIIYILKLSAKIRIKYSIIWAFSIRAPLN